MLALSDSSVTTGCSASTVSPTFTRISITGTSLKSPMSGIVMSIGAAFAGAGPPDLAAGADLSDLEDAGVAVFAGAALVFSGAGAADLAALAGAASAFVSPSPDSTRAISVPIDTLSPTLAATSATVPATGEGTSIVALSDSSEIRDTSALTTSPGLTSTSMTGTSLKSPISGTFTSTFATGALSSANSWFRDADFSLAPDSAHQGRCHI